MSEPSYALERPGEILAILDRLRDAQALIAVTFDDAEALVSSILEVSRDTGTLVFDVARDPAVNERMLASRTLHFTSELDHVQIAFDTAAAQRVSRRDGPAATVDLPRAVTRLQRRESFRAALPVNPPIHCTVVDSAGWASVTDVIDLSCGGAALVSDERSMTGIVPGSSHELILSLPDMEPLGIEASLRTVMPAGGDASSRVRLGFRFDHVPAGTAARIQRYVQQVEVRQLRLLRRRG